MNNNKNLLLNLTLAKKEKKSNKNESKDFLLLKKISNKVSSYLFTQVYMSSKEIV